MVKPLRLLRTNAKKIVKVFIWLQIFGVATLLLKRSVEHDVTMLLEEEDHVGVSPEDIDESHSGVEGQDKWKFKEFELEKWNSSQRIVLKDDTKQYFSKIGESICYTRGTTITASEKRNKCVCQEDYFGSHCGIPGSAWYSYYKDHPQAAALLVPRLCPRRLIHGLQVNHEFDMTEARVESLGSSVDAYIVMESNYTTYGSPKALEVLGRLKEGWLADHQHKMAYVFLSYFTENGKTNGWFADSFLRLFLGKEGMKLIAGERDDDVFLLLDADELPAEEALIFLKVFDGWTEPVQFGWRWTIFGFYWLKAQDPSMFNVPFLGSLLGLDNKNKERLLTFTAACTVGMLKFVYGNNAMLLRRNVWTHKLLAERVALYKQNHTLQDWTLGTIGHYAGFHCSWCYDANGIRTKLMSAQKHDKPRWGDYPEKLNLTYIENLIRTGGWFDGTHPFISVNRRSVPSAIYAPQYMLDNEDKFEYLLVPPADRI